VKASSERARRVGADLHGARGGALRTSAPSASREAGRGSRESAAESAAAGGASLHGGSKAERKRFFEEEWKRFFEHRDLGEKRPRVRRAPEKSRAVREVDGGGRVLPEPAVASLAAQSSVGKRSTATQGPDGAQALRTARRSPVR